MCEGKGGWDTNNKIARYVLLCDLIPLLIEYSNYGGDLENPFLKKEIRKPTHGICCTCQICGYGYDECVCDHNAIVAELQKIVKEC